MSKAIELKEPSGAFLPVAAAREAATEQAENAELSAKWIQRFRKPGRTEAEAVRLAEAEAHRLAQVTLGQAVAKPITEAEKPDGDAVLKARAGWVRRFLSQGRSAAEAERLADLTFAPKSGTRFFSGAAPKTAPARKRFFSGGPVDLAEPAKGKV